MEILEPAAPDRQALHPTRTFEAVRTAGPNPRDMTRTIATGALGASPGAWFCKKAGNFCSRTIPSQYPGN